jgi:hypothetical protein
MKANKIIIGGSILAAAGVAAYFFLKKKPPVAANPGAGTSTNPAANTQVPVTPNPVPAVVGGARVSHWPEGSLIRHSKNEKVFVIDAQGYRRYITNRQYFDRQGWNMKDVRSISLAEMIAIPEGARLAGLGNITHLLMR